MATTTPFGDFTACVTGNFVGDSGSGGSEGHVPAPPAGSGAAGKFLKADGTWTVPPSSGGMTWPSSPGIAAKSRHRIYELIADW